MVLLSEEHRAIMAPTKRAKEAHNDEMRRVGRNGEGYNKSRFALAIDLYIKCVSRRYTVIYIAPSLPGTYTIPFVLHSHVPANNLL